MRGVLVRITGPCCLEVHWLSRPQSVNMHTTLSSACTHILIMQSTHKWRSGECQSALLPWNWSADCHAPLWITHANMFVSMHACKLVTMHKKAVLHWDWSIDCLGPSCTKHMLKGTVNFWTKQVHMTLSACMQTNYRIIRWSNGFYAPLRAHAHMLCIMLHIWLSLCMHTSLSSCIRKQYCFT